MRKTYEWKKNIRENRIKKLMNDSSAKNELKQIMIPHRSEQFMKLPFNYLLSRRERREERNYQKKNNMKQKKFWRRSANSSWRTYARHRSSRKRWWTKREEKLFIKNKKQQDFFDDEKEERNHLQVIWIAFEVSKRNGFWLMRKRTRVHLAVKDGCAGNDVDEIKIVRCELGQNQSMLSSLDSEWFNSDDEQSSLSQLYNLTAQNSSSRFSI